MTAGVVLQTALTAGVIVITAANVALWAFRPLWYHHGPRLVRAVGIVTLVRVIFLPLGGGLSLGFGADDLAGGHRAGWQEIVVGVIALVCWPVAIAAQRKRRAPHAVLSRN